MAKKNKKSFISDYSAKRYGEIITQILNTAEKAEWKKPWIPEYRGIPCRNIDRPAPYEGINAGLLDFVVSVFGYKTPFFMTMDRAKDLGLTIKMKENEETHKMEREAPYPVWKWFIRKMLDGKRITDTEYAELTEEDQERVVRYWSLRIYFVYNLDQTSMAEDLPKTYEKFLALCTPDKMQAPKKDAKDEALDYILNTEGAWRCPISFDGGDRAYYTPGRDSIHLPKVKQFRTLSGFYGTALHEMAHSTMGDLKRNYDKHGFGFGSEGYALEELVAEFTAAFVCHDRGITKTIDPEHIAYVKSWRKAISKGADVIAIIVDDLMKCVRYEMKRLEEADQIVANVPVAIAA